jgi:hypothetical protein
MGRSKMGENDDRDRLVSPHLPSLDTCQELYTPIFSAHVEVTTRFRVRPLLTEDESFYTCL